MIRFKLFQIFFIFYGLPNFQFFLKASSDFTTRTTVKVFDRIGLALVDKTSTILITNGFVTMNIRIELNLPMINLDSKGECKSKEQPSFNTSVTAAQASFKKIIERELEAYIEAKPVAEPPAQEVVINTDSIKADPFLCDSEDLSCEFMPILDADTTDGGLYQLRPCLDLSLGKQSDECSLNGAISICCSKNLGSNNEKCPTKNIQTALNIIKQYERAVGEKVFSINENWSRKPSDIKNYCIAISRAYDKNDHKVVYHNGPYSSFPRVHRRLPQSRRKRDTEVNIGHENDSLAMIQPKSRSRRSNWKYYMQGGFFTSSYIDSNIERVEQLEKADVSVLKDAVQRQSKILLTLQGDLEEKERLRSSICETTTELSEDIVLLELKEAQTRLEFKSEEILKSCSEGTVPDHVETDVLTKVCSAVSSSSHCIGPEVRALFSCKLRTPLITTELVGVTLELSMSVPVSENYSAYKVHSIGIPLKYNAAVDSALNLTAAEKVQKLDQAPIKNESEELKSALLKIINSRKRRDVSKTHHFVKIASLPEIIIEFNGDYLAFNTKDCQVNNFGTSCDYSENIVQHNLCVKSIFDKNVAQISHFCSIEISDSNYECSVKSVGRLGYLISTLNPIEIDTISGNNKVFNNNGDIRTCKHVCFIGVSKVETRFRCGTRSYRLESRHDLTLTTNEVKIQSLDLTGLKSKSGGANDLVRSGFEILDEVNLTQNTWQKISTISVMLTLMGGCIMTIIVLRCGVKRLYYRLMRKLKFKLNSFHKDRPTVWEDGFGDKKVNYKF